MTTLKLPGSPKKLTAHIKNKLNSVHNKKCKAEFRSTSLEGWTNR